MSKGNIVLTIPEPNKMELVEKPYPNIKPGYLIVRNEYAGVCLEGTRIWAKHDFEKFYGGGRATIRTGWATKAWALSKTCCPARTSRRATEWSSFRAIIVVIVTPA